MSLENRVNKTLNSFKRFKSRAFSNAKRAAYIGLISLALAGAVKSTKAETSNNPNLNARTDSYWADSRNQENEFIPSPEKGYVIKTENETDINLLNNILSLSGKFNLKKINLLKVDIEGAEWNFLEDFSKEDYKRIDQISIEFHDFIDSSLKYKSDKIVNKLKNLGYSFVSTGSDFLEGTPYKNCLFYKSELLEIKE